MGWESAGDRARLRVGEGCPGCGKGGDARATLSTNDRGLLALVLVTRSGHHGTRGATTRLSVRPDGVRWHLAGGRIIRFAYVRFDKRGGEVDRGGWEIG